MGSHGAMGYPSGMTHRSFSSTLRWIFIYPVYLIDTLNPPRRLSPALESLPTLCLTTWDTSPSKPRASNGENLPSRAWMKASNEGSSWSWFLLEDLCFHLTFQPGCPVQISPLPEPGPTSSMAYQLEGLRLVFKAKWGCHSPFSDKTYLSAGPQL